jgi:hypothetical protein
MAITAQAFKKVGDLSAIVASQQLAFGGSDTVTLAYRGFVTFTLDGATTTATVNFIDGTAGIGFTPSGVYVDIVGGTQLAAAEVRAYVTAFNDKTATVVFSGAGTNANTLKLLVTIIK